MISGDENIGVIKPRRRRLSSYRLLRDSSNDNDGGSSSTIDSSSNTVPALDSKMPQWLKALLKDDIHTGHNLGSKMAYFCQTSAPDQY